MLFRCFFSSFEVVIWILVIFLHCAVFLCESPSHVGWAIAIKKINNNKSVTLYTHTCRVCAKKKQKIIIKELNASVCVVVRSSVHSLNPLSSFFPKKQIFILHFYKTISNNNKKKFQIITYVITHKFHGVFSVSLSASKKCDYYFFNFIFSFYVADES